MALIFDGFQLISTDAINQDLLNECRNLALEETGYDIELKIKPFDNILQLPDNYADCDDDLPSLINKYKINLNNFIENNNKLLDTAIIEDGSHFTISNVAKSLLKETIIYDECSELWFYCNIKNIWKKSKTALFLKVYYHLFLVIYLKSIVIILTSKLKKILKIINLSIIILKKN